MADTPHLVTLKHIRYGKVKFDLGELRRRLEARIAGGAWAANLGRLLVRTTRLIALLDAPETGRTTREIKTMLDAELALLLLDFELVQSVMAGGPRRKAPRRRTLPAPKRKLTR